ncbi:DUF2776 family protein [Nocardioides sp. zg-536]|uniref:DUF2776 family protein n=1 Tax=Nocardioides faecalis TaxID=2803858 RepID=A0A939BRC1_9ACTN|nr:DUF2776 family protein [Nocardioides faecalis]MBM9458469.1 DUF2776 family protein [Nocardioides faecalis]MBS4752800.1 DUF2776 family protein [Nocardioides faecalis]QVI58482.1 DUF2776 family protein [Nocardioides faecalis]
MNYWVSVLFRAIPLAMGAVCVGLGVDVWTAADQPGNEVAGRVVTFLAAICVCLFCTAATIIRQLIHRFNTLDRWGYPILGYLTAAGAAAYGVVLFSGASAAGSDPDYVAGHVVLGLGLISGCVATVATASTRFSLIPANSARPAGDHAPPAGAFGGAATGVLCAIPVLLAAAAWAIVVVNLAQTTTPSRFTVGHVLAGIATICTSLIALVVSIVRQVNDAYTPRERVVWPWLVIVMGTLSLVWGIVLLILDSEPYYRTPGLVMIGLGLVCFSILSKVGLLALVWRRTFALANRVPLIPVLTALTCLFLAAFTFQAAVTDSAVFVAARVLTGLGAICFTLYSIVSILESGTSSSK